MTMDLAHFRFEIGADGVALMTWDAPGRSMNVITQETMRDLAAAIDRVAGDSAIKGCVIVSGKKSFSGGADLVMIEDLSARYAARVESEGESAAAQGFLEDSSELSWLYRRLETCGKPFAAAIDGVCLGGAFELALACRK
jgi:3-hydroxyacyl-CoA dehydrogenase/enoyl-CoA hydratase/3-hydroxybutyryl-CoA epimerase